MLPLLVAHWSMTQQHRGAETSVPTARLCTCVISDNQLPKAHSRRPSSRSSLVLKPGTLAEDCDSLSPASIGAERTGDEVEPIVPWITDSYGQPLRTLRRTRQPVFAQL